MRVLPNEPVTALTLLEPGDCVNGIELFLDGTLDCAATANRRDRFSRQSCRAGLDNFVELKNIRTIHSRRCFEAVQSRTFPICPDLQPLGKTLTLGLARFPFP